MLTLRGPTFVDTIHRVFKDGSMEESSKLNEVSVDDILVAQREEHLRRQEQEKLRNKVLLDRGLQSVKTSLPPTSDCTRPLRI